MHTCTYAIAQAYSIFAWTFDVALTQDFTNDYLTLDWLQVLIKCLVSKTLLARTHLPTPTFIWYPHMLFCTYSSMQSNSSASI